jgi:transposase
MVVQNTREGFEAFWGRIVRFREETGAAGIVCAVEPTGRYHQALAYFLESRGADVVFVSNHVADLNRRTLDGTWDKNDPRDAHNLCDLLEQGKVLFYSLPGESLSDLRRLVRLLRRVRVEEVRLRTRIRNGILPVVFPEADDLLPNLTDISGRTLLRLLPDKWRQMDEDSFTAPFLLGRRSSARLDRARALHQAASRTIGVPVSDALAFEIKDLAENLEALRERIKTIEGEVVRAAEGLPGYALLLSIPGIGPTLAAVLLAETGDIRWYEKPSQLRKLAGLDIVRVQSGRFAGTPRISRCGRPLLRWALYQAALGAARTPGIREVRARMTEKRAGDRHAFFKANVELSARILRIVWGVLRSGKPYDQKKAFACFKAGTAKERLARMPQEAKSRGGTTRRPSGNASLAGLGESARTQAKKRRDARMAAV